MGGSYGRLLSGEESLGSANALLLLVGGASVTVWLHKHSMLLKADLSRIGRVEHLQPGCEHRESKFRPPWWETGRPLLS